MEWLILIGFLLFTTIVYVYLQKLVMKLPQKILHFVPIIFFCVLTVYGFFRSNGIMVYYSDTEDSFLWTDCAIAVYGLITSIITMIVVYLRRRKEAVTHSGKIGKVFAVAVSFFLLAVTGFYVCEIALYDYTQNTVDYKNQKLVTVSDYMFDKLHDGVFYTDTYLDKRKLLEYMDQNKDSDVYNAVRYSELTSVGFLDEHTVKITGKVLFHSISGYLITDGRKNYKNGFYKISGSGYDGGGIYIHRESENIYSWSAGQ